MVEQHDKLHADIIWDVKLELLELMWYPIEKFRQRWNAQQTKAKEIKLLSIRQRCLIGQIIV